MSLYPAPRPIQLGMIPSGPAGIAATLKIMAKMARTFKKDVGIREVAGNLVRGTAQYDNMAAVRALHAFVRDAIRYTGDIAGVETLQTPKATLELGVGDCDDKSLLLAALLQSINLPARFVAIAMNGGQYSHVLVETRQGKGWIPLETIRPVEVGWFPPNVTKKMIVHI